MPRQGEPHPVSPLLAIRIPANKHLKDALAVEIVDQLLLPHAVEWITITSPDDAWDAIRSMKIRGAPAIASLAALSIAINLLTHLHHTSNTHSSATPPPVSTIILSNPSSLHTHISRLTSYLVTARPTAVNLREALDRIDRAASHLVRPDGSEPNLDVREAAHKVVDVAIEVWTEDVERNHKIGDNGAEWLLDWLEANGIIAKDEKINVLTVCNTGSLATSGYGTALGVVASLHRFGRLKHCYFAQTGPYLQGARLTSLELQALNIPSTMVLDTAMAALIDGANNGVRIHGFLAGADRVTSRGDTANKISTYQISTLASALPQPHPHPSTTSPSATYTIPVLICAPLTTIDFSMTSGSSITIEQRPEIEACTVKGRVWDPKNSTLPDGGKAKVDGASKEDIKLETVLVTPVGTRAWNPAFDVTPARLIDAIVTEVGVAEKAEGANEYDLLSWARTRGAKGIV